MDHYALGQIDARLVRQWAENSGEAVDWYTDLLDRKRHGGAARMEHARRHAITRNGRPATAPTASTPPASRTSPEGPRRLHHLLRRAGEERFETTDAESLIVEDGRVAGAYAPGGRRELPSASTPREGVVVATGGYAYNQDMYAALQPTRLSCLGTFDAFPTCTGDGIKALLRIGAQHGCRAHLAHVQPLSCSRPDQEVGDADTRRGRTTATTSSAPSRFCASTMAGARFHNESAPYDFRDERLVQASGRATATGIRSGMPTGRTTSTACTPRAARPSATAKAPTTTPGPRWWTSWIAPEMEQLRRGRPHPEGRHARRARRQARHSKARRRRRSSPRASARTRTSTTQVKTPTSAKNRSV